MQRAGAAGKTLALLNPATGAEIARLAHAEQADLEQPAAGRGARLFGRGATLRPSSAARSCTRPPSCCVRADAIARLLMQEKGKTLVEAKGEVMAGANIIDWFAEPELLVRYSTHAPYNVS